MPWRMNGVILLNLNLNGELPPALPEGEGYCHVPAGLDAERGICGRVTCNDLIPASTLPRIACRRRWPDVEGPRIERCGEYRLPPGFATGHLQDRRSLQCKASMKLIVRRG